MSATEDDTELRDLLIQNLENNGVLNKLKAELRAAVFLSMEEQDKVENKSPLINENLRTCLSSEDGRLVASLIVDFLQVFNLDFTLAVFQPEINMLNGLDSREVVCRDLGLSESQLNRNSPVLLELVRRGRNKLGTSQVIQDSGVSHAPEEKVTFPPVIKEAVRQQQDDRSSSPGLGLKENLDLDLEVEDDLEDGDSFFDDPLPKPQKTYGWKAESTALRESPAGSQSEAAPPGGGRSTSEQSLSRNGASECRHTGVKDLKALNDKTGSLCLDDDVEYDDDFNSHRSDLSKTDFSIGEEIEEVSIEGPDGSNQLEDSTQDLSVSQLSFSQGADYMEDVS
ncbi:FGFR1 oncogene partner [Solea solea]|uniref:FGFR1 oncogene partner n=1 Tax=Solea solea TaxID=90069 RepID=UPI00272C75DB|nr:FGFR1 oncogene partner [Solea solea]